MSQTYLGLMSGTSCDGFDLVALKIEPSIQLLAQQSYKYPPELSKKLLNLAISAQANITELGQLDIQTALIYATAINQFCQEHQYQKKINALGLHGHTLRHYPPQPNLPAANAFTWQLGSASTLAQQTQIPIIHNFRHSDIACGGQGAPLAPIFHQHLLNQINGETPPDQTTAVLNLGGIANLSLFNKQFLNGFDTGPANTLIDAWVRQHQLQPQGIDLDGKIASKGKVSQPHLQACLNLSYFQQAYPKSTGREQFNLNWLNQCWQSLKPLNHASSLATLYQLTVQSIGMAIQLTEQSDCPPIHKLYITGGGHQNPTLMAKLKQHIQQKFPRIDWQNQLPLPSQYIEASAWAYLAYLHQQKIPVNLQKLTGSHAEKCVLGELVLPPALS